MWAADAGAALRARRQEQTESARRARAALALTLANQLDRGAAPEELVLDEYRTVTREHREVASKSHDYSVASDGHEDERDGVVDLALQGGAR
ncbi:hypothetical protein [Nocardioides panzhihuensis]|uniref:Uncharacterized protein n=1 Tax=Nocardioides panzhihuensis TaxID=860243 RepID=A0A7Z0DTA1_9ACTN|nr:hypothetical protein [Nocardioides panzhihuensis]NYI81240.1 hypothetical protein [Nocardioides panzhihuensis]